MSTMTAAKVSELLTARSAGGDTAHLCFANDKTCDTREHEFVSRVVSRGVRRRSVPVAESKSKKEGRHLCTGSSMKFPCHVKSMNDMRKISIEFR
jgi:hypothetical protein